MVLLARIKLFLELFCVIIVYLQDNEKIVQADGIFTTVLKVPEGIYSYPKILTTISSIANSCYVDSVHFAPPNGLRSKNKPPLFGIRDVEEHKTTTTAPHSSTPEISTTASSTTNSWTTAPHSSTPEISTTASSTTNSWTTAPHSSTPEISTTASSTTNSWTAHTSHPSSNSSTARITVEASTVSATTNQKQITTKETIMSTSHRPEFTTQTIPTTNNSTELIPISITSKRKIRSVDYVTKANSHFFPRTETENVTSNYDVIPNRNVTRTMNDDFNKSNNMISKAASARDITSPMQVTPSFQTRFSGSGVTNRPFASSFATSQDTRSSTTSPSSTTSTATSPRENKFNLVQLADLDREKQDKHLLTVQCRYDSKHLVFLVLVQDINDNTPVFETASLQSLVPADLNLGDALLQIKATDADIGINAELVYRKIPGTERLKLQNGTIVHPEYQIVYVLDSGFVILQSKLEPNTEISFRVNVKDRGHYADGNRATATAVVKVYDKEPPFPSPTSSPSQSSIVLPVSLGGAAFVVLVIVVILIYIWWKKKNDHQRSLLVINDDLENFLNEGEEMERRENNESRTDRRNDNILGNTFNSSVNSDVW